MPRHTAEIAADFDTLNERDFDYANAEARGWERLDALCEELREGSDPEVWAPVIFGIMERLDSADLGTPGPLVHTLEIWCSGIYEPLLAQSIRRKPTPLSVWMVNRILNARPADTESWIELLRSVADNPASSDEAKAEAQRFIEYQVGG